MLADASPNIEPAGMRILRSQVGVPKAIGVLLLCMNAMLRTCRQILLVILVLLAAAWATGEAEQWLLRWRANKLLSDVRSLEVERSGWADAQQVMRKWGQWGSYKGSCTSQACMYQINLVQTLPPVLGGYPGKGVNNWLPKLMGHLGLRGGAARAGFAIEQGVLTQMWFGEQVTLPVQDWDLSGHYVPYLSVASGGYSRFPLHTSEFPHLHPYRMVQAYPHGMTVIYSPEEAPAERALLLDFRFTCITRLRPCRSEGEMLPEGWRMLQEQQQANPR